MTRADPLLRYLGRYYSWGGGKLADGLERLRCINLDCSGFAQAALLELGLVRPDAWHDLGSLALANACDPVTHLQPGDLVFYGRPVSHVMVVFEVPEDGRMTTVIGASGGDATTSGADPTACVQIRSLHYRKDLTCCGRIKARWRPV